MLNTLLLAENVVNLAVFASKRGQQNPQTGEGGDLRVAGASTLLAQRCSSGPGRIRTYIHRGFEPPAYAILLLGRTCLACEGSDDASHCTVESLGQSGESSVKHCKKHNTGQNLCPLPTPLHDHEEDKAPEDQKPEPRCCTCYIKTHVKPLSEMLEGPLTFDGLEPSGMHISLATGQALEHPLSEQEESNLLPPELQSGPELPTELGLSAKSWATPKGDPGF